MNGLFHIGAKDLEENFEPPEEYAAQSDLDELRERVEALEKDGDSGDTAGSGATALYIAGVALAMILSWSRNASILWCMVHGLVSWVYVIYFAFTR